MIINHNMASLNTYRQMSINETNTKSSLEKLSSGLRINKAGDDAAGLAISEKMRGQIRGLDQASRNAQDSISLINTAEGALNETHSILQRMRELSVQSANDTNTVVDRGEIQKEVSQLTQEVDRIANTTEFNTKKLLNGDSGNKVVYGTNAAVASATTINDSIVAGTYAVVTTTKAEQATVTQATAAANGDVADSGAKSVVINGTTVNFNSVANDQAATLTNLSAAVNNANIGITASSTGGKLTLTSNEYGASQSVTVKASATTAAYKITTDASTDLTDTGVDVAGTINAVAAQGAGRTLTAASGSAIGLKVTLTAAAAGGTAGSQGNVTVNKNALTTHIGANENQTMSVNISSMGSVDLGINGLDVTSQTGAESAITTIQSAIERVSAERSKLGAYTNRLEHTIANLGTSSENVTAAESRVRDVDMAKEMMNFQKNNILSQAAQAMLAQANQQPQGVLQLLR
jgi:flagellin